MAAKPIPELTPEVQARFWAKVDVRGPDECWEWRGTCTRAGYGRVTISGLSLSATHIALALDGRPRHDALLAIHSCDNPRCVNAAHLRWGTHADNASDKVARDRCARLSGILSPTAIQDTSEARAIKAEILASPLSIRKLAARLGMTSSLIVDIRRGRKWKNVAPTVPTVPRVRTSELRGINHPFARLTIDDVRLIRASDESSEALASRIGCSVGAVRHVRAGNSWAHSE